MAYNPNIPQPSEQITKSQRDFLGNFTSIYQLYGLDHVNLDANEEVGFHEKLTLVEQGSGPTTGATESALYTKRNGVVDDLYVRQENSGTEIKITDGTEGHINIVPRPRVAAAWDFTLPNLDIVPLGEWVNVAGVTTPNLGAIWTITFANPLPSDEYYVLSNAVDLSGRVYDTSVPTFFNYTSSSVQIRRPTVGLLGFGKYYLMVWQ
jgi:hypothetical protein